MKFIVFHGAFGSPESNWFPDLKEKLEALGQEVLVPSFPVDDWIRAVTEGDNYKPSKQNLEAWLKTFQSLIKQIGRNRRVCFIGHSLGCLFILHAVEKYDIKLDCAIFVSPFLKPLHKQPFDSANQSFYKDDFDWNMLRRLIPVSYVLYSENDPYIPAQQFFEFAERLNSSKIPVMRAGHLNIEVNLNELPLVYELCKSRINLSLYQRYLEHRRELYPIPRTKNKVEEVIYLDPREVVDEGKFHFRNLRKGGFCTLYTAPSYFAPHSVYMETGRDAARRVPISRVLTVSKLTDLKKAHIREQIRSDIAGGIEVYLCMWSKVKDKIPEPDFGIWDDEYLCVVSFDKNNRVKEERLDSRGPSIAKAKLWKRVVLKSATKVRSLKDVEKFLNKNSLG